MRTHDDDDDVLGAEAQPPALAPMSREEFREEFRRVQLRSPLRGPIREAWMCESLPYGQDAYVAGWLAALRWKEQQSADQAD